MMKKLLVLFSLIVSITASAQLKNFGWAETFDLRQKLFFAGKMVNGISDDTSNAQRRDTKLWTEKAGKDFAKKLISYLGIDSTKLSLYKIGKDSFYLTLDPSIPNKDYIDSLIAGIVISGASTNLQQSFDLNPTANPTINAHDNRFFLDSVGYNSLWRTNFGLDKYAEIGFANRDPYMRNIGWGGQNYMMLTPNMFYVGANDTLGRSCEFAALPQEFLYASLTYSGQYIFRQDTNVVSFTAYGSHDDVTPLEMKVGINVQNPDSALQVHGGVILDMPTKGAGKVLTSGPNGEATWQTASGGGSGTVSSVTSADANATVASTTTNPVITIVSAPKFQTARTINGISFDGTSNITITAAAATLTGTTLNSSIVNSSLTSVGTITTGVWHGTGIDTAYTNAVSNINVAGALIKLAQGKSYLLRPDTSSSDINLATQGYVNRNFALTKQKVTTTQMNAIGSPADGLEVYNTDEHSMYFYNADWGWESDAMTYKRKYGYEYFNEFHSIVFSDGFFTSGGNTPPVAGTGTSTRPGVLTLNTSTSTTGRSTLFQTNSIQSGLILGNGKVMFETAVRIPTLSNATDAFAVNIGLIREATSITSTNGVFFTYDSSGVGTGATATGRWQVVTSSGSTRSFTTTSVQVVANQWYTLKAVINAAATSVDFYIDNVLVKTETTNIPTATGVGNIINLVKSAGTTARTVDADYYYFKQKYTTAR
jgi:hypothetical protein